MEADDLLCSRNARSRTPLVGRAQWKINQPPSLRNNERAWKEYLFRSTRAIEDQPAHPLKKKQASLEGALMVAFLKYAVSEGPRWTRAVGDHLASPQGRG